MFYVNKPQNGFNNEYIERKTQNKNDAVIQALLRSVENKFIPMNIRALKSNNNKLIEGITELANGYQKNLINFFKNNIKTGNKYITKLNIIYNTNIRAHREFFNEDIMLSENYRLLENIFMNIIVELLKNKVLKDTAEKIIDYIESKGNRIENAYFNMKKDLKINQKYAEKIYEIVRKNIDKKNMQKFETLFQRHSIMDMNNKTYITNIYNKKNIYIKQKQQQQEKEKNNKLFEELKRIFTDTQFEYLEELTKNNNIGYYIETICAKCLDLMTKINTNSATTLERKTSILLTGAIARINNATRDLTIGRNAEELNDEKSMLYLILSKIQKQISIIYTILYLYSNKHSNFDENNSKLILINIANIIDKGITITRKKNKYDLNRKQDYNDMMILDEFTNTENKIDEILNNRPYKEIDRIIRNLDMNCYLNIVDEEQKKIFENQLYIMKTYLTKDLYEMKDALNELTEKYKNIDIGRDLFRRLKETEDRKIGEQSYAKKYGVYDKDNFIEKIIITYMLYAFMNATPILGEIIRVDNIEKNEEDDRLLDIIIENITNHKNIESQSKGLNINNASDIIEYFADKYAKDENFRKNIDGIKQSRITKRLIEKRHRERKTVEERDKEAEERIIKNLCDIQDRYIEKIIDESEISYNYNLKMLEYNCCNIIDEYIIPNNNKEEIKIATNIKNMISYMINKTDNLIDTYAECETINRKKDMEYFMRIGDRTMIEEEKKAGRNKPYNFYIEYYDIGIYDEICIPVHGMLSMIYSILFLSYVKPHSEIKDKGIELLKRIFERYKTECTFKLDKLTEENIRDKFTDYNRKMYERYKDILADITGEKEKRYEIPEIEKQDDKTEKKGILQSLIPYFNVDKEHYGEETNGIFVFEEILMCARILSYEYEKIKKNINNLNDEIYGRDDFNKFYVNLYNMFMTELKKIEEGHYEKKYNVKNIDLNKLILLIIYDVLKVAAYDYCMENDINFAEKLVTYENKEKNMSEDVILDMFIRRIGNINKEKARDYFKGINEKSKYKNIFTYYGNAPYEVKKDLDKIKNILKEDKKNRRKRYKYIPDPRDVIEEKEVNGLERILDKNNDSDLMELEKVEDLFDLSLYDMRNKINKRDKIVNDRNVYLNPEYKMLPKRIPRINKPKKMYVEKNIKDLNMEEMIREKDIINRSGWTDNEEEDNKDLWNMINDIK